MKYLSLIAGLCLLSGCAATPFAIKQYEKEGMFVPVSETSSSSIAPAVLKEKTELIPDEKGLIVDDHVKFSIGTLGFHVRKEVYDVKPMIEALVASDSQRCGEPFSESYKTRLLDAYSTGDHFIYTVYDPAVLIQTNFYSIEVIPNAMEYKSVEEASADLDTCAVGPWWATQVSPKWILSRNSACGGAAVDGDRCGLLQEIVSYTVTLR